MKYLNIALAQINPTVGDIEGNLSKILKILEETEDKAHIVVFPELALTGYPLEDLLLRRDFLKAVRDYIQMLTEASSQFKVPFLVGAPSYEEGKVYNSALLFYRGELLAIYHKRFLPQYGVFEEKRYFTEGSDFLLFSLEGIKIGVSICEDIWFPTGLERVYSLLGAQILISINASPYAYGKFSFKENFLRARAEDNQAYVVYVNLVGGQDDLVFDGRSMVISPRGRIVARAKAFEEDLLIVSLDTAEVENVRLLEPRLKEERVDLEVKPIIISAERELAQAESRIEDSPSEEAEIYSALKLALKDYVEKNGFKGVILGLSGGIDSALTLVLAVDSLGQERVKALFMPSEFTSFESKEDAKVLAQNLGIELLEIPITEIFRSFREELSQRLSYEDFTVAEENLQARIRANLLFYLSNREGYLVLSTSNKSEAATGYGTIYGDIAGGFAPLKDIYKTWVYRLARYRNSLKPVIPERIFTKPPSAELRPGQTDQETLPPYEVLDEILRLHLEEGLTLEEIVAKGLDEGVVKKVLWMIKVSEYKRRQAPVGPKITGRALGRDYHLPITSGFYFYR